MKRIVLFLVTVMIYSLPGRAVLTENNLNQTLEVLNVELSTTYQQLKKNLGFIRNNSQEQHEKMIKTMERSNEIALMLYSQNYNYTFNQAYACHEATAQYHDFTSEVLPYDKIMGRMNVEIQRYARLARSLQDLPPSLLPHEMPKDSLHRMGPPPPMKGNQPFMLNKKGQADRLACLHYARAILKEYKTLRDQLSEDSEHYQKISQRLKADYDYARQRYKSIQKSIFINGEENYYTILTHPGQYWMQAVRDISNKYGNAAYESHHVISDWRGPIVFGLVFFVVFYILLAFGLSNLVVRLLMKKVTRFQEENVRLKMNCIILAASFIVFALAVMSVRVLMKHSFIIMASQLLVNFAWLIAVIFVSLIIRLQGRQINSALRIYMPIILLGLVVIVFRIIFIPNSLANLIFPPILVLFTVWQWWMLKREKKNVPASDRNYSWVTLILMMTSCVMALMGYVLMSVQTFIWWLIQLTLIQTITCFYDWGRRREEQYLQKKLHAKSAEVIRGILKRDYKNIQFTWFVDFIGMVLIPFSVIFSVLFAIYYAAEVFDLTEICTAAFFAPFVSVNGICKCSVFMFVLVICLFFVFNYVSYAVKGLYRYLRRKHLERSNGGVGVVDNQANLSLFNNVMSIILWGIYLLLILSMLHVPKSGLSLVSAGLATGVGFAMKDLIENFFYGISLMTGRLRSGDWIECDGVRGVVDTITYQSTQIVTDEGEVIAFLNSTLFNKNFKNLTRNHLYEMSKISVGVAYGTNINEVRALLTEAVKSQMKKGKSGRDIVSAKKGVTVLVSNFGESSIDLLVIYWTLVEEKNVFDCLVKEAIYNALNEHHIEIPFPQRDVRFRSGIITNIESKNQKNQ